MLHAAARLLGGGRPRERAALGPDAGTGALFILGVPIVSRRIASLGALVLADVGIVILSQKMIQGSTIFSLLAVPCFILAGDIMQTGGLARA